MNESPRQIDPQHGQKRRALRIIGPIVLAIGVVSLIIGMIDFILSIGTMRVPVLFIIGGMGALLIPFGLFLTSVGFMGAIARYQAGEVAPVASDTINYMGRETQPGVRHFAAAIGSGLRDAAANGRRDCSGCGTANDADARFCDACGQAMDESPPGP